MSAPCNILHKYFELIEIQHLNSELLSQVILIVGIGVQAVREINEPFQLNAALKVLCFALPFRNRMVTILPQIGGQLSHPPAVTSSVIPVRNSIFVQY